MSSIYLSNAIFMMIILTIIFLRIRYYITWSPSKKYTMIFIGMVELYVLMDALFMKELLGKSGNLLQFKLVVFFFYLVYVIMPYVWHLFMQSYMGIIRSPRNRLHMNVSVKMIFGAEKKQGLAHLFHRIGWIFQNTGT